MFDPEYTISLYFNGDSALTQADVDQLSDWIELSDENAAKFIQVSFIHRAIHDSLVGADIKKNVLLDIKEGADSGFEVVMDSKVSVRGVEIVEIEDVFLAENQDGDFDYGFSQDGNFMQAMLELAKFERTAPAVIVEKPVEVIPRRELIQKVDNSDFKIFAGKVNKLSLAAAVFLGAAFLSMLAYVYFNPVPELQPIVAQLVDQIDAEWDQDMQLPDFDNSMRQTTYGLSKGYASIRFKNGVMITVEAPAEWSLLRGGDMELFAGRIYAVVPERAHGFTVMARDTKIVDLGTEFGVEVDKSNNTQLHVTRGETLLFSGDKNSKKPPVKVNGGAARQIDSAGIVRNIGVARGKFVKWIDSKSGVAWNGKNNLGPAGDGLIFNESFERPVVKGYSSGSVPGTNWVATKKGYGSACRGLYNEGNADVFSTPYGQQGYMLNYTNSGLTTSKTAITEVLTAGRTYAVTFNMAYALSIEEPKLIDGQGRVQGIEKVKLFDSKGNPASEYHVELVAFEPGDNRASITSDDVRFSRTPGKTLALATGLVSSNEMTAGDSIVFTPKADDPNLGKKIAIRLVKRDNCVLYDNVQLRVWKSK